MVPSGHKYEISDLELYKEVLEYLPNMVFIKDAKDLRFLYFNLAGEQLLSVSRNDLIGKTDHDLFPKDQADFFVAKDREVLNAEKIKVIEEESVETPEGQKWLRTRKVPLSVNGEIKYLLGISEDITELKVEKEKKDAREVEKWVRVIAEPYLKGAVKKVAGPFQDVSDSISIINQLRETTEELNCFFKLSVDLLVIVSPNGYLKEINPAFIETLGYSEEELKSRPFFDFICEQDVAESEKMFESVKNGEILSDFEVRFQAKSGDYRHISWSAIVDNEKSQVYAVGRDQTDIRSSEQELKTYSRALDNYAIIVRTDQFGIIRYVNDKFVEVSGYERSEVIGKTHRVVNSDYHSSDFFNEMWETIKSGHLWRGEIRNKAKDGSLYWVDTTIAPLFTSDGNIKEYISFRYDITEQKNGEIMLEEQKGHLDRLIANSPGMVYQFKLEADGKMYFPFVSKQAYEIYEVSEEQYCNNPAIMVENIHEDDTAHLKDLIMKSARDLAPFEFEGRIVVGEGDIKWIHARSVPSKFADNSILWDGILIDITSQKILEEQLEGQRLHNEHQARLASIGELAAGVGHEINNPLAIVKSFSHLIRKKLESGDFELEPTLKTLEKIDKASDRIGKIVKGLRTFSRSDLGNSQVFDLKEAVNESFEMLYEIFDSDQIKLSFECEQNETFNIHGSRSRMQQVLMNLLTNARDAMKDQENKEIRILLYTEQNKHTLVISDNGPGICSEIEKKVFDPFFTTKEVNQGTGLGLSLAHSIVKDHLGELKLKASKEKGAIFEITLPRSTSSVTPVSEEKATPKEVEGHDRKYSVLVVDDEEGIRELLVDILKKVVLQIDEAPNGQVALDKIKEKEYDLVISDVKMPVIDGPGLLREIANMKKRLIPKFIFITGGIHSEEEIASDDLAKYIDSYISKPFEFSEVIDKVQAVLKVKGTKVA